ncbi:MAG TPA: DUF4340 domain-containing protein [Phycisphaerales bacterium]|nr:DUF4340 domain-containing protein [Phycisphaerales bacterium]HMP38422.1 DUF4340 domain-containing protein [Phycisphaerales bacterium]
MRWSTTAALLAAAAIAVAVSLRYGTASEGGEVLRPRAALRADALPVERIAKIEIVRPGRRAVVLERSGHGWIERMPSGLPVDPFIVREVIAAAAALEVSRVVPAAQLDGDRAGRARLGLDEPVAVRFIWDAGSTEVRLGRLGVAGRAFAEILAAGEPRDALVVGRDLHDLVIGGDPAQWRVRSLFPEAGSEAIGIRFEAGDTVLELRRDRARWELAAPMATRADRMAADAWLATIARAEGDAWIRDLEPGDEAGLRSAGLNPPAGRLTVRSRSGTGERSRSLLVGAPLAVGGADRFAMLDGHPALMQLGAATLQGLFPSPLLLVEPTAAGAAKEDIRAIAIIGPLGEFELVRDLDGWRSPQAPDAAIDRAAVATLLQRLVDARATSISLEPLPEESIVGRIRLAGFDAEPLAALVVAATPDGSQWAIDGGDGVLRIFPASLAPSLDPRAYGIDAESVSAASAPAVESAPSNGR